MRLSDEMHQSLKIKAIKDDVSIQGFLETVIEKYVEGDLSASELIEKIKI